MDAIEPPIVALAFEAGFYGEQVHFHVNSHSCLDVCLQHFL